MTRRTVFGMTPHNGFMLILFVLGTLMVGYAGSIFTMPQIPTWYASLVKPELTPPSAVFGPVWTTLYILMGYAAFRVYKYRAKAPKLAKKALMLYVVHLLVNFSWSVEFFAGQNPEMAVAIIVLLWSMIAVLFLFFSRIDKFASMLLIPYLAWVTFATYLNISFALLN